jgi:uncharacterized protein (UPF0297 family)
MGAVLMNAVFLQIMKEIVKALEDAGYDPYEQLVGFLRTGEDFYITRQNGAREKITQLDKALIQEFVYKMR